MLFLKVTLVYLVFVTLKAWNDVIYIKRDKVIPTHTLEWSQVAFAAILGGLAYSNHFASQIAYAILMIPITWTYQDLILNVMLGVSKPLTYVGSGYWDNRFKDWFGHQAITALYAVKALFLIIATIYFLWITR